MFEIERDGHLYGNCQVCGADKSDSINLNIYSIKLMNKNRQGVELRLCSHCCDVLSKITAEPDNRMHGIRMMSVDELE